MPVDTIHAGIGYSIEHISRNFEFLLMTITQKATQMSCPNLAGYKRRSDRQAQLFGNTRGIFYILHADVRMEPCSTDIFC